MISEFGTFFGSPRSLAKRLHDVLTFKVRAVGKDLIDAVAGDDLGQSGARRRSSLTGSGARAVAS